MKIPESSQSLAALIDSAHEQRAEPPRPHLGASQLGHPCDRWLWLSFRWAVQPAFPGRILRLFRRGQNEEATVISDLRAIGLDVRHTGGSQSRVDFGSHVSGSIDGIIESGVPEAPKKRHVLEIKTHNARSFEELLKCGVQKSKFEHWLQMQLYMHGTKIDRALYAAVCKNDDRIYTERVRYDRESAERAIERGHRIAQADRMPPPTSADPSWYICKMCPAHKFCHYTLLTEQISCRTCAHSTAKDNSTWHCAKYDAAVPVEYQRLGCDGHALHPDMVPWSLVDGDDQWTAVYVIDGVPVLNGDPAQVPGAFTSRELLSNPQACARPAPFVADMRADFGGRITG